MLNEKKRNSVKMDNNTHVSVDTERPRYTLKSDSGSLEALIDVSSASISMTGNTSHHRSSSDEGITLTLQDIDLWSKFNSVTNEMIVTKSGR